MLGVLAKLGFVVPMANANGSLPAVEEISKCPLLTRAELLLQLQHSTAKELLYRQADGLGATATGAKSRRLVLTQ